MKPYQSHRSDDRPITSVIQELVSSFQNLLKSEIHLIRAEVSENTKIAGKHSGLAIAFGVVALLGLLPFVAFLVIGLGKLLNENYWLSSLIVSLVFISIGAILGYQFTRKLVKEDLNFPHTRNSLQNEAGLMRNKVQEISKTIQRRVS